ncbi:hypothetical protein SLA2020_245870 [Shorea laevis]
MTVTGVWDLYRIQTTKCSCSVEVKKSGRILSDFAGFALVLVFSPLVYHLPPPDVAAVAVLSPFLLVSSDFAAVDVLFSLGLPKHKA